MKDFNSVEKEDKINWSKIVAIGFILFIMISIILLEDFLKTIF